MAGKPRRPGKSRQGRGVLVVLALMFLLSGALRVFDGAATAASRAPEHHEDPAAMEAPPAHPEADVAGLAAAMNELRDREERVAKAERALADRMRALEIAEATVDSKLAELAAAEERLSATMARSQTAAEDDVSRLTSVYENMKPKEATEIFARMAPEFAAGFLGRMRADAAAQIMSGLEPEKAYAISVLLAGRNAGAPTE